MTCNEGSLAQFSKKPMLASAKNIGAGLATIGLAGAGVGIIIILYFVFFMPTVYCEEFNKLFPVVQQFTDLSSLETKSLIREVYSKVSGIYIFQCTETGGMYIGSSINLYDRFYAHLNDLSSNLYLQNAANKYGWDSFNFRVIETCSPTELVTREQFNLNI